jgi:hypothetical protein
MEINWKQTKQQLPTEEGWYLVCYEDFGDVFRIVYFDHEESLFDTENWTIQPYKWVELNFLYNENNG